MKKVIIGGVMTLGLLFPMAALADGYCDTQQCVKALAAVSNGKIKQGMTWQQVIKILGKPTSTKELQGNQVVMNYGRNDKTVSILFLNGKVIFREG